MSNTNTPQDLIDNLNYLNETKNLIRQAITNKGQEIKDDDTFRSYAAKISNIQGTGKAREASYSNIHLYSNAEDMVKSTANDGDIGVVYNTSNDSFGGIFIPNMYYTSLTNDSDIFPAVFNLKIANLSIVKPINTAVDIENFYSDLDIDQIYFSANADGIDLIYPIKNFTFNLAKANNALLNMTFQNDIEFGNIPIKIEYRSIINSPDTYRLYGFSAEEYIDDWGLGGIVYPMVGPLIEEQMYEQLISTYNDIDWKIANNIPHVNYILNSKTLWSPLYTQHNAKAKDVLNKGVFYSRHGVQEGTLASYTKYTETDIQNVKDIINLYMGTTNGITTGSINDCSNMFIGNEYVMTIPNFDTSNVTNMAYMFGGITDLKTHETVACNNLLFVPNFNTSKVNNMHRMFNGCISLTSVPNFNTAGVLNFCYTFGYCTNLTSIPNFTFNVNVYTYGMFYGCKSLASVPNFNLYTVKNTIEMFQGCESLETIPNFDLRNSTNTARMFSNCKGLKNVPNFNLYKVTNSESMFNGCLNLKTVPNFNTSNMNIFESFLHNCPNLTSVPNFNMSKATTINRMFTFDTKLTSVPNFNTINVTNAIATFSGCTNLTSVPNFNFSKLYYAGSLFTNCYNLRTVPNFNFSNLTSTGTMFGYCNNLNTVPNFNTSKVNNMSYMFQGCTNLTSVPNFDTANVLRFSSTFANCNNLVEAPSFNTNNAIGASSMFANCTNLKVVPSYNTSKMNDMAFMFSNCTSLEAVPALNYDLALNTSPNYRSMFKRMYELKRYFSYKLYCAR